MRRYRRTQLCYISLTNPTPYKKRKKGIVSSPKTGSPRSRDRGQVRRLTEMSYENYSCPLAFCELTKCHLIPIFIKDFDVTRRLELIRGWKGFGMRLLGRTTP